MNYRAVSGVVSRSDCDRITNRLDISTTLTLSRNDIYWAKMNQVFNQDQDLRTDSVHAHDI